MHLFCARTTLALQVGVPVQVHTDSKYTVQLAILIFTTHTGITINLMLPHLKAKIQYVQQQIIHIQPTSVFIFPTNPTDAATVTTLLNFRFIKIQIANAASIILLSPFGNASVLH